MPPMHKYYSSTLAKKRAATAEAAEAAGGEKRGAQGGAPDEPPARRQKKSMDPVAPYRRRIGLANRDGNVDDGLAAFDELHAAGSPCRTLSRRTLSWGGTSQPSCARWRRTSPAGV